MSVIIIAVASESGVPIFSRKRGNNEHIQFCTIASLHGINMFAKCHNVSMIDTKVDNGTILWKEYCKSVTLIGIATGGLECDLELLLSCVHDLMIFFIGKKELENLKNIDQVKRELRQCYPLLDCLLESLDPSAAAGPSHTLLLDLIQSMLCPQAQELQQALDSYAALVCGRWACLSVCGLVVARSGDFLALCALAARDARLLQLLAAAAHATPLTHTPVYLPVTSPNVAFRAVICKLLADVFVLVVCGAAPALDLIDPLALHAWAPLAPALRHARRAQPDNLPATLHLRTSVLGILVVNISLRRCVFSRQQPDAAPGRGGGAHRTEVLRTFYVTSARHMAPELSCNTEDEPEECMSETYWCSEYHLCYGARAANLLCCALFPASVPTHTARLITNQTLQDLHTNKDIHW